jgi:predicted Zn finger-like uncharacterized protein
VAIVCPQCAVPAALSAEVVSASGRLLRCKRCGTTWLARAKSADWFGNRGGERPELTVRRTGRPRFERVIEHGPPIGAGSAPPPQRHHAEAPPGRGRFALGRVFGSWAGVVVSVFASALVAIVALQLSAVGAPSGEDLAKYAGLEIRLVRAAVEPARSGRAVVVIGEIVNRTGKAMAVPAVRIALLSRGSERRSWYHAPAETRLAAGQATLFRSTLATPPADVDAVTFRLAERQDMIAGMR